METRLTLIKMAASIGRSRLFLTIEKRCLLFHPPIACERLTYCRKVFYSRVIKEHSANVEDHKITTESKVDQSASDFLEQSCVGISGFVNYKRHPGAMRKHSTKLPLRLVKAVKVLLERYPVEELTTKTQNLVRYLHARHPPVSDQEIKLKAREVEQKILEKDERMLSKLQGEEHDKAVKELKKKVLAKLRTLVYHWQPMQYDAFTSYIYMMGRLTSDYAVILQCFTEIAKRDPEFKPTSIFHFGSRVGSGIWFQADESQLTFTPGYSSVAADRKWRSVGEHYCVDSSGFMNTVARLLLQDGNEQNSVMSIKGVNFRQFLPSPKENTFSMVVCPYMLMEQASDKDRLQLVLDLWEMTDKYLVFIENGTTAGFNLIDEAKEFLLQVSSNNPDTKFEGHVFSPCPHDSECPKKRDKKQPCLTECVSNEVNFSSGKTSDQRNKVRYSFVVLKKGPRESEMAWPRVLQLNKARRHNHCHVCLPCGKLQHVVVTKGKFEKHLYGCSKHVDQGDFLPVQLSKWAPEENTDDNPAAVANIDDDEQRSENVIGDGGERSENVIGDEQCSENVICDEDGDIAATEGCLTPQGSADDGDDIRYNN